MKFSLNTLKVAFYVIDILSAITVFSSILFQDLKYSTSVHSKQFSTLLFHKGVLLLKRLLAYIGRALLLKNPVNFSQKSRDFSTWWSKVDHLAVYGLKLNTGCVGLIPGAAFITTMEYSKGRTHDLYGAQMDAGYVSPSI